MRTHYKFVSHHPAIGPACRIVAAIVLIPVLTAGCAMNQTEQRTGAGAAIGALGGALLGTSRESAAGGYIYDQYNKRED
jgi:hypothetical protein